MASKPKCVTCGVEVDGYKKANTGNVKCDGCRKTPVTRRTHTEPVAGKVLCKLCGVARRRLGSHLKSVHSLTGEQYQTQFPDALVEMPRGKRSAATKAKQAEAATKRWAKKGEREAQSERLKVSAPWKGKKLSKEHREAIAQGGTGVKHNMTPEGSKVIGDRGRKALEKIRKRPAYRGKLSTGQKRRFKEANARGEKVGFQNRDVWQKGYDSKLKNGTLNPQGTGRGITGFRKGILHYCRSTLEANFARILLHEGIPYEHEPRLFKLAENRHYTPDFYLEKAFKDIPKGWVELKGWRKKTGELPGDADAKIQEFEQLTGEKMFVIVQSEKFWKSLALEYSIKVDLWEVPGRNLKSHPTIFGAQHA